MLEGTLIEQGSVDQLFDAPKDERPRQFTDGDFVYEPDCHPPWAALCVRSPLGPDRLGPDEFAVLGADGVATTLRPSAERPG